MVTETGKVNDAIAETYLAADSFKQKVSDEERVNKVLDRILDLQKDYEKLNTEWISLNELVEDYISSCRHPYKELVTVLVSLEGLIAKTDGMHKLLEGHRLASILLEFEETLAHTKELRSDIKIKISELPSLKSAEETLTSLGF